MMAKEPIDQLDSNIIDCRVNLHYDPSHISRKLKTPLPEIHQRMERLGLRTDERRKIQDYEAVKGELTKGLSFKEIAVRFGVHEERIRDLAKKWGFKLRRDRDIDDNEIIDRYVNKLQSSEQIHEEMGYGLMRVRRRLKELGVARTMHGTKSARTRGKASRMRDGYPMAKIPEGHITRHRHSDTSEYAPAYIIEMEKKLGRPLTKEEVVHHIDLDKMNCIIENLHLCANHSEHSLLHWSLESINRELIKEGKIVFDGKRYRRLEDLKKKGIE
jgi:hypothetical protein